MSGWRHRYVAWSLLVLYHLLFMTVITNNKDLWYHLCHFSEAEKINWSQKNGKVKEFAMELITMNWYHLGSKYSHPFIWLCVCIPFVQGLLLEIRNGGIILVIYFRGNTWIQGRALGAFAAYRVQFSWAQDLSKLVRLMSCETVLFVVNIWSRSEIQFWLAELLSMSAIPWTATERTN